MKDDLTATQRKALALWQRLAGHEWTTGYAVGSEPSMCKMLERKGYAESRKSGRLSSWGLPITEYRLKQRPIKETPDGSNGAETTRPAGLLAGVRLPSVAERRDLSTADEVAGGVPRTAPPRQRPGNAG